MAVVISVTIKNLPEIKRTFQQMPLKMTRELGKAVERVIFKIEGDTKKLAPVNKQSGGGNLRQSIKAYMRGAASGVVDVGADYGIFVHEGTKPHIIRVVNKRVLANKRTGQIFGRVVRHPGTKANPFLQNAVDQNKSFIDRQFEIAVENVIK
jgi:HK97 gp10 family phage protein